MRLLAQRWQSLAMLSLALLVTACGSAGGTAGTGTSHSPGGVSATAPKSSGGAAATTGISTVTFTASGGLSGPITLSDQGGSLLLSYHLAAKQHFFVDLEDNSKPDRQQIILDFQGYTGQPGTYTVSPVQAGATADEAVHFELYVPGYDLGTKLWLLDKSAAGTCTVIVTSVTSVHLDESKQPIGQASDPTTGYSEVQGTIVCPSVPMYLGDGTPPLTVSDGRFDLLMAEQQ